MSCKAVLLQFFYQSTYYPMKEMFRSVNRQVHIRILPGLRFVQPALTNKVKVKSQKSKFVKCSLGTNRKNDPRTCWTI